MSLLQGFGDKEFRKVTTRRKSPAKVGRFLRSCHTRTCLIFKINGMRRTFNSQISNWRTDDSLFSANEEYFMAHNERGRNFAFAQLPEGVQRQMKIDNMHLVTNLAMTDEHHFPFVQSYTGSTEFEYVSYSDRKKSSGAGCALGFFEHDYKFVNAVWDKLETTTYDLQKFEYVFAPDFSLYVEDALYAQNVFNVYKSRTVAAYWQYCGMTVIPVATWGNANSFSYCFEGLPEESVIAVCGIGHDRNPARQQLWAAALFELERLKHPLKILVYGGKPCSIKGLNTELAFIDDFITRRFRDEKYKTK